MSISKSLRFEVFKRDGFQCAYCGQSPPQICLEIDHIDPKMNGGKDGIKNLVTSCFDCNRGKRHISLTTIPAKLNENLEILAEREAQLKEYRKLTRRIERRIQRDIASIAAIYTAGFPEWQLSSAFRNAQVRTFVMKLPLEEVREAMYLAVNRGIGSDRAINYFCGICWNKIKELRDAE